MSLVTPGSVQKLQTALHDKAKKSPDLRFHALYVGCNSDGAMYVFASAMGYSFSCVASDRNFLVSLSEIGSFTPSPALHETIARRVPRRTLSQWQPKRCERKDL